MLGYTRKSDRRMGQGVCDFCKGKTYVEVVVVRLADGVCVALKGGMLGWISGLLVFVEISSRGEYLLGARGWNGYTIVNVVVVVVSEYCGFVIGEHDKSVVVTWEGKS